MILEQLLAEFNSDADREFAGEVVATLAAIDRRLPTYVLYLADGDLKTLLHYAERAEDDYRDLIYWTEAPSEDRLNAPEKRRTLRCVLEHVGRFEDVDLAELAQRLLAD